MKIYLLVTTHECHRPVTIQHWYRVGMDLYLKFNFDQYQYDTNKYCDIDMTLTSYK